jgi:perosamine synthetase
MNMKNIPIYAPDLNGNEKKYVNECIDTSWISSRGRFVSEFEREFSKRINVEHATAVSNGTVALHLALVALGIGPGDEVIVPTLTYIASVNAITYTGATPVFCDSVASSWQMDSVDVERRITSKTRAILPVHLYGQSCDVEALMSLARKHDLFVIEDCAEAFGTMYKGKHVGVFGDISTFSFFGNKTITTGEGGMVVSNDKTLIERARHLKGQGLASHMEYWHDVVGYNYRMTNIQAAIGLAQLERSDQFISNKRAIAESYKKQLSDLPLTLHSEQPDTFHSYWMVSVLVEDAKLRDPLREYLKSHGIETRPLFYPVHTMPMHSKNYHKFPVAENLAWRGINLPSWPGLSDEQVSIICKVIKEFFQKEVVKHFN